MRLRRTHLVAFISGIIMALGARMAHADLLGLDGYIEMCRSGWVNMSPAWGFGAMVLALVGLGAAARYAHLEDAP